MLRLHRADQPLQLLPPLQHAIYIWCHIRAPNVPDDASDMRLQLLPTLQRPQPATSHHALVAGSQDHTREPIARQCLRHVVHASRQNEWRLAAP